MTGSAETGFLILYTVVALFMLSIFGTIALFTDPIRSRIDLVGSEAVALVRSGVVPPLFDRVRARWHRRRASDPRSGSETRGSVAVSGTTAVVDGATPAVTTGTDDPDGTVTTPGTGTDCLAYRCTAYELLDSDTKQLIPRPERVPVRTAAAAVPFAVVDGDERVVVDPRPLDPAGGTPGPGPGTPGREAPGEWSPPESVCTVETVDLSGSPDLDEEDRDRLAELFDGTGLRPGDDDVAIGEWRLEPGEDVEVLGIGADEVAVPGRDVLNVVGSGHPFEVAPADGVRWHLVARWLVATTAVAAVGLASFVALVVALLPTEILLALAESLLFVVAFVTFVLAWTAGAYVFGIRKLGDGD